MEQLRKEISKILNELLREGLQQATVEPQQKKTIEPKMVRFNTGLDNEYSVIFSERGFLIDETRMSFEELQDALSKEYIITLKSGTILDAVKMQQIMKYKGLV